MSGFDYLFIIPALITTNKNYKIKHRNYHLVCFGKNFEFWCPEIKKKQ
jgi:hypothetical protein